PPRKQANVYLLLESQPEMGELYYFYCFDRGFHTFRVTNYSAYCPDARRADGSYPVCIELHFDPGADLKSSDLVAVAADELMKFGVIKSKASISFSKAQISNAGFPVLTLRNTQAMRSLRESVRSQEIRNLIVAGQAPDLGIFFLHDVLEHNFNALRSYLHWN
ncbi:MAG TPA: hypothetical protein VGR01_11525, partial [Burkholderiales bacterium]|nr:hypothetical protein [Burkholderiales bacterium]